MKIGDEITLINKGIRNSCGSTYVDELLKGSTSFLKITKIGTKYVYGVHFWFEKDGDGSLKRQDAYYENKHDITQYWIFSGVREDLKRRHEQFRKALDDYEKARQQAERQIHYATYRVERRLMERWIQKHPRPTQEDPPTPHNTTQNIDPLL